MPFIQEVGLEILIIVFCINGMLGYGVLALGIPIYSPFDIATPISPLDMPQSLNVTNPNNLLVNVTTNPANSTSSNSIIDQFFGNVFIFFQYTYIFLLFISGGFIWSFFAILGMPTQFVLVLEGIIVILLARTAYYYVIGR